MTPEQMRDMSLEQLTALGGFECVCGRHHGAGTKRVVIERGATAKLPSLLSEIGSVRPFIISGHDSFAAAGDRVAAVLDGAGIPHGGYVFPASPVQPTERSVGTAVMHFDHDCDAVIGIGSGVINDIGKMLARVANKKYIIVATAPSMDGYASSTSSMEMDGLKVSLESTFAWAIVGDLDILCAAPMRMLQAGVGDMLAKYVSLCEWKIASMVVGEYYCPTVAALVAGALARCVAAAPGLADRKPDAVKTVMEGMVIAGMAMTYAGLSRPASGMEHYFSHIWDMRSLVFEEAHGDLHGIQCGVATLLSLRVYEYLRTVKPDRERALRNAGAFSLADWNKKLTAFIGPGAAAMMELEKREGKYDVAAHRRRLEVLLDRWEDIMLETLRLPRYEDVKRFMRSVGAPVSAGELGHTDAEIKQTFMTTKDIRDKYIASRLAWDLGLLEDAADALV